MPQPFNIACQASIDGVRSALDRAGYTEAALDATVKGGKSDIQLLLYRTREPSPYNTLVRLFRLAQEVSEDAASTAFAPLATPDLVELGLLRTTGSGLRSVAALRPSQSFIIANDFSSQATEAPPLRDHVIGIGEASVMLASLAVRRKGARVLDLCAGAGIQGLIASRHASAVTATDINPRALNFAAFNLRLNRVENVELVLGNLYEPVEGRRFDLILANPPFVVSPGLAYEYRDSGLPADSISEQVIRRAPGFLDEGGYATILCNWINRDGEDWKARPSEWLGNSGCDAWIMHAETEDPAGYAAKWLRPTDATDRERYARLFGEWVDYYKKAGIVSLTSGAITMRRRSAETNWLRADALPDERRTGSCSDQIMRIFAAQDLLEGISEDSELLDLRFGLSPDDQLVQMLHAQNGQWARQGTVLKLEEGLEFSGEVDPLVLSILEGCDLKRPLREILIDLSARTNLDLAALMKEGAGMIRKLLRAGFVVYERAPSAERRVSGTS